VCHCSRVPWALHTYRSAAACANVLQSLSDYIHISFVWQFPKSLGKVLRLSDFLLVNLVKASLKAKVLNQL